LTGTQVLLLVVSETGLVYTFTTVKLQPIVTKPEGKSLIQACLNAPDPGMEGAGGLMVSSIFGYWMIKKTKMMGGAYVFGSHLPRKTFNRNIFQSPLIMTDPTIFSCLSDT
jgi:hypothetical protein